MTVCCDFQFRGTDTVTVCIGFRCTGTETLLLSVKQHFKVSSDVREEMELEPFILIYIECSCKIQLLLCINLGDIY